MSWISDVFYNDIQYVPVYLLILMVAFIILGTAIFFHELGHWLYFRLRLKKKDIKIYFVYKKLSHWFWQTGNEYDYQTLSDHHYKGVLLFGVLLGTLPIILAAYIWLPFVLLLLPYIAGSWNDLKNFEQDE